MYLYMGARRSKSHLSPITSVLVKETPKIRLLIVVVFSLLRKIQMRERERGVTLHIYVHCKCARKENNIKDYIS